MSDVLHETVRIRRPVWEYVAHEIFEKNQTNKKIRAAIGIAS